MHKRASYSSRFNQAGRHVKGAPLSRDGKPKKRCIFVIIAILVVVGAIACAVHMVVGDPVIGSGEQATIEVAQGESTRDIADALHDAHLVSTARSFTDEVEQKGVADQLKPGTYTFAGGTSVADIVAKIAAGPDQNLLTIPEGYTIERTAEAVESAYHSSITKKDFLACAKNASNYAQDFPFVANASNNSLEGFLYPDSYAMHEGDTADTVIREMLTQYQNKMQSLDYSYTTSHGLSSYQALILASIVEREAAPDNRATVASVFYNRLAKGMPLQSDATVAYVVGHDPTTADLKKKSPYNTYLTKGLPPGPICSPSLASMQAVLAPESTDYLYFYFADTNGDGTLEYYFSKTYEEHQAAIAKAQKAASDAAAEKK